ncbi:TPA: ABC transporter permease [Candidatus Geothermarchaeota archaeon]|nr:ABC transporter permease [Candidatus Geothermarchaeota archaeon]HIQ13597.1 ABC transporter permease [Thermoprotei archaeon]
MTSLKIYIISRLLITIPTIFILLTLVFIIMRVLPGNPVLASLGVKATDEDIQRITEQLGLNRPLHQQYIEYITNVLTGNLGNSLVFGRRPVINEIADHFPATIELTIGGFIISVLIGISLGILGGVKPYSKTDTTVRIQSIVAYTLFIPLIGLVFQYIFGVILRILPVGGRIDPLLTPERITGLYIIDSIVTLNFPALISSIRYLILPSLTLGIVLSGVYVRLVRSSLIEVLSTDYIRSLRSRGIRERDILFRHALKNALIPLITMMGLQFSLLLAGAVLTETTFSWPGIGTLLMERILYRDFTTVQGIITIYAVFVALISLIVDIIYAYVDPRIRY